MRVLVTAASKHGATLETATAIGPEVVRAGIDANGERLEDVSAVGDYDGVVVGSALVDRLATDGVRGVRDLLSSLRSAVDRTEAAA